MDSIISTGLEVFRPQMEQTAGFFMTNLNTLVTEYTTAGTVTSIIGLVVIAVLTILRQLSAVYNQIDFLDTNLPRKLAVYAAKTWKTNHDSIAAVLNPFFSQENLSTLENWLNLASTQMLAYDYHGEIVEQTPSVPLQVDYANFHSPYEYNNKNNIPATNSYAQTAQNSQYSSRLGVAAAQESDHNDLSLPLQYNNPSLSFQPQPYAYNNQQLPMYPQQYPYYQQISAMQQQFGHNNTMPSPVYQNQNGYEQEAPSISPQFGYNVKQVSGIGQQYNQQIPAMQQPYAYNYQPISPMQQQYGYLNQPNVYPQPQQPLIAPKAPQLQRPSTGFQPLYPGLVYPNPTQTEQQDNQNSIITSKKNELEPVYTASNNVDSSSISQQYNTREIVTPAAVRNEALKSDQKLLDAIPKVSSKEEHAKNSTLSADSAK